jgi:hypothetical protein
MARKKALNENAIGLDDALASIIADARDKFGDDKVYSGKESEARLVGIYLPALALRYFYQCNIMPLSRMVVITGTQESCKSAFLYEHYRWFRRNAGRSFHVEAEAKDSDALRMSILDYDYKACDLLIAESLEDWQSYLSYLTNDSTVKARLIGTKEAPGPGKTVPICFGLDSITAKASREIQEKMEAAGYADRVHPLDAMKISSYLKYFPQRLVNWPFLFAAINHLKPTKGPTGAIDYHVPGGFSLRFQETFEVRMQRVADIDSGDNGVLIKFTTQKNSLGPGRKSIQAGFRWFFDDQGRQHSYWDWNSATIELLDKGLKTGALRSACMDIVDIRTKSAGGKKVWSKTLDISESDAVPYSVAGAMLEQRPDLLAALHRVLGIREYTVFKQGVDYGQQLKEATVAIERAQGYTPSFQEGEDTDETYVEEE